MPNVLASEDLDKDENPVHKLEDAFIESPKPGARILDIRERAFSDLRDRSNSPGKLHRTSDLGSNKGLNSSMNSAIFDELGRFRSSSIRLRAITNTGNNTDAKKIITIEVESRSTNNWIRYLKTFVLLCRIYLLTSPSLITNLLTFKNNTLIYNFNFLCSMIIFVKINLVLRKKRRHYFRTLAHCIDYIATLGSLMSSFIYTLNEHLELGQNSFQHYYFWSFCCFCNIFNIINHLKQFRLISETFSIIMLALKLNYPFFYVMLIVYCVFATTGNYLFGGNINSNTPAEMDAAGQKIHPLLVHHNWNDFFNSMVFLYSINLNNNLPAYINMSTVQDGQRSTVKMFFFFIFYLINNFILMNIFIGQIIEISLCYFKSIYKETKEVQVMENDNPDDSIMQYRVKV